MKRTFLLRILLSGALFGGASAQSQAQTSVATDPVGFASATINSGYNALGNTFTSEKAFQGTITAVAADSIDVQSAPTLAAGNSYYIEVTSGNLIGERIDVASVTDSTVTLDLTAAHNTLDSTSTLEVGESVCIKEHFTLGDFIGLLGDNANGSPNFEASESDQILLFDGGFKTYILWSDDGEWYEYFGDFNFADATIVPPGAGLLYYRNPNPAQGSADSFDISFSGSVRNSSFVQVLKAGYQLVTVGFPLPESPGGLGFDTLLTGSPNFDPDESDQILTWDAGFKTHILWSDDGKWYQYFGDFNDVTDSNLFSETGAVIVKVQAGQALEIPVPFNTNP